MYTYVRAVALSRTIGAQWEEIDLSQVIVYDIYAKYSQICLELSNNYLPDNVFVDMDSLKEHYLAYNGTLEALLIELADITLPYIDKLPSTTIKYAKYSDAVQSAYKLDICKMGYANTDNTPLSLLTDIVIARPSYDTDMSLLHSHCLLSVNGYYHSTDTDGRLAYIKDGAISLRKSNVNHVGILSFLDIGKLTKLEIDPTKVRVGDIGGYLKDKIYIDLDTSLAGKSYFLVLGGYLVFPKENVLWARSDTSIALQLGMLPYLERIYESSLYLDVIEQLGLTTEVNNPDKLVVDEVYSDATILKYLTLSQSFIVVVDTPNLDTRNIGIRSSNMPGVFTCCEDPTCPLIVGHGKVAEYWKVKDGVKWSVNCRDSYKRNYILDSVMSERLESITGQLNSQRPYSYSRGFLLEISGYR